MINLKNIKIINSKILEYTFHLLRYFGLFYIKYNIKKINFGGQQENNFFLKKLKNCKLYIEYGSGSSTLIANKFKKKTISIEGDKNFYHYLKKKISYIIYRDLGIVSFYSVPLTLKYKKKISVTFKKKIINYCKSELKIKLLSKSNYPILILVDGRFRVLVCLYIYKFLNLKKSIFTLIIDDYKFRKDYHVLEQIFYIKKIGRFGVANKLRFLNKKNFNKIKKNNFFNYI